MPRKSTLIIIGALFLALVLGAFVAPQLKMFACDENEPYQARVVGYVEMPDGSRAAEALVKVIYGNAQLGSGGTNVDGRYDIVFMVTDGGMQHVVRAEKGGFLPVETKFTSQCSETVPTPPPAKLFEIPPLRFSDTIAPLVAGFNYWQDGAYTVFEDASSGVPSYWEWDFGDGKQGTGRLVRHRYTVTGTYDVTLSVTRDEDGAMDSITKTIHTSLPISQAGIEVISITDLTVRLKAHVSGGSPPFTFQWDFGDGTTESGETVLHVYAEDGSYTVTLGVTDSDAHTFTVFRTISVYMGRSTIPLRSVDFSYIVTGTMVEFTSIVDGGVGNVYSWTFGDGSTSTSIHPVHTYASGTYTVTLQVRDNTGVALTTRHTVTIVPPTEEELAISPMAIVLLIAGLGAIVGGVIRRGRLLFAIPIGAVLVVIALLILFGVLVVI